MTDRELMQMALDALEWCYDVTEWPANGNSRQDKAIDALRARLAQPEPEPVAWMYRGYLHEFDPSDWAEGEVTPLYAAPPHFLDPAKIARLMDEAFERGKKEIDMEQVKDIAQKLADCALLNSAPPQREWKGLTDEEIKNCFEMSMFGTCRAIEEALRRKNT